MMEYKHKKMRKAIMISLFILIMGGVVCFAWIENLSPKKFAVMGVSFTIFVIYIVISDYRRQKVIINNKHMILHRPKGIHPIETKLEWKDIRRITSCGKFYFTKEVSITTRYKCITMHITSYKNYKEMLRTIVEKTKNNDNIKIDEKVINIIDV